MEENKYNNNAGKTTRFIPVIIAVSIVVGILIGTFYANHFSGNRLSIINTSSNKLNDLLRIIDDKYVDTVSMSDLVEEAMPQILAELDPHSTYIPAKDVEASNADLKGHFSGIGVSFTIQQDTICINNVIQGGPSEKVGLIPGDRIVTVDDSLFVGKKVTNEAAMGKLKGEKGTTVKLGIKRAGVKDLLSFSIVRGDIPVKSVDCYYMLTDNIGYIKIKRFAETTYAETMIAIATLDQKGCKALVIDLRGNVGGYLGTAVQTINEFLPKNRLIVYTEGRKSPREEFRSDGRGTNQKTPLVVLTDEISASASEIFAGAIQDNDRGTIIGRRTFGKGLVQQPIDFRDGSSMRLTIARYYTPSGRCIQKPYVRGQGAEYEYDIMNRFNHGEFFSEDSIRQNTKEVYHTSIGRTVYGGGGIMPDIFVPQDTTGYTSYYMACVNTGVYVEFGFQYTDKNREKLKEYKNEKELADYLKRQNLLEQFVRFAETRGIKRRNLMIRKSRALLEQLIYGSVINYALDFGDYIEYLNETDPTVLKAIDVINKGEAFPKPPVKAEKKQ